MAWGVTAPAAITALVALPNVAAPIIDAAVVSDGGAKEAVNIGYQTEDQDAVEATLEPYVPAADSDVYTINCAVRVLRGRDLPAARARAFVLFNQVGSAIKANRHLGLNPDGTDVVMDARVSSYSLQTVQSDRGPVATILFGVTCQAETTE
jgi:hypothetical protein